MKKLENFSRRLSKKEQKEITGGLRDGGTNCLKEFTYGCCLDNFEVEPCCAGLVCQINATNSGTICVSTAGSY